MGATLDWWRASEKVCGLHDEWAESFFVGSLHVLPISVMVPPRYYRPKTCMLRLTGDYFTPGCVSCYRLGVFMTFAVCALEIGSMKHTVASRIIDRWILTCWSVRLLLVAFPDNNQLVELLLTSLENVLRTVRVNSQNTLIIHQCHSYHGINVNLRMRYISELIAIKHLMNTP